MHRLIMFCGIAIVAAALLAVIGRPVASADKEEPGKALAGKFVSILRKSGPDSPTNLEKARVVKLEDRSFLAGTGVDMADNWQKGRSVWIALDDIGEMTFFDTLEELKKALSESDPKTVPPAKT
jgi:hypothetical protein